MVSTNLLTMLKAVRLRVARSAVTVRDECVRAAADALHTLILFVDCRPA